MANGLPVVSTQHAGIPEAVLNGVTGYLVEEGDVDGMARAIAELVGQPELSRRLGHAGWQRAKQYFSWQRERTQLLALLGLSDMSG
jgi:glycosyltransferase involved in cell wall biosynthesis